jgi:hypothetical protein
MSTATLEISKFMHKPVFVEAVQVTAENMEAIADWCGGAIQKSGENVFIKANVPGAKSNRHTKAFAGDWVLKTDHGVKIYTPKAFEFSFQTC